MIVENSMHVVKKFIHIHQFFNYLFYLYFISERVVNLKSDWYVQPQSCGDTHRIEIKYTLGIKSGLNNVVTFFVELQKFYEVTLR